MAILSLFADAGRSISVLHTMAATRGKIQNADVKERATFAEIQRDEGLSGDRRGFVGRSHENILDYAYWSAVSHRVKERSKLRFKIKKKKKEKELCSNCPFYSAACRAWDIFLPFFSRAKLTWLDRLWSSPVIFPVLGASIIYNVLVVYNAAPFVRGLFIQLNDISYRTLNTALHCETTLDYQFREAPVVNIAASFSFRLPWNRQWLLEGPRPNSPSWPSWQRSPCSCWLTRTPWVTERRTRCTRTSTRRLPSRTRPAAGIAETACSAWLKAKYQIVNSRYAWIYTGWSA